MPKSKVKIKEEKKNYLNIVIGVFVFIVSILILGRVSVFSSLYLLFKLIFGDFSSLILIFLIIYSVADLILNKKINLHHIYFIGIILIYIGLSLFAHLGLYDALEMSNKDILIKSLKLYSNYLKHFEYSFSCGGGIIVALIAQIFGFIGGKIAVILVGFGFMIIGISYIIEIKLLKIFKTKSVLKILPELFKSIKEYFLTINYPKNKIIKPKLSLSILDDKEDGSYNLQEEINKEKYVGFQNYLKTEKVYAVCDNVLTSYTSSRFVVKIPHKSENVLSEINRYFNKNCFIVQNDLVLNVEIPNQFKRLLTLKKVLLNYENNNKIPLCLEIDATIIDINIAIGNCLCVIGDNYSGIKTFIRCYLSILFFKNIKLNDIYMFDFSLEYNILDGKINYVNDIKKSLDYLNESFNEYERRMDTIKYLEVDNIVEANKKIKNMGSEYEELKPLFYIINYSDKAYDKDFFEKLSYLIQYGKKVGINILLITRNKNLFNRVNISNCNILSFYSPDVSTSIKLFGSDIMCKLQKKGDVLYLSKNKIYHGQTPYISVEEFERIIHQL